MKARITATQATVTTRILAGADTKELTEWVAGAGQAALVVAERREACERLGIDAVVVWEVHDPLQDSIGRLFRLLAAHRGRGRNAKAARNMSMAIEIALGGTLDDVGAVHGITRERVRQIMAGAKGKCGLGEIRRLVEPRDAPRYRAGLQGRRARGRAKTQEMLAMRFGGAGNVEIAAELGVAKSMVATRLQRHRVEAFGLPWTESPYRGRPRERRQERVLEAQAWRAAGLTCKQIAVELGLTHGYVTKLVMRETAERAGLTYLAPGKRV